MLDYKINRACLPQIRKQRSLQLRELSQEGKNSNSSTYSCRWKAQYFQQTSQRGKPANQFRNAYQIILFFSHKIKSKIAVTTHKKGIGGGGNTWNEHAFVCVVFTQYFPNVTPPKPLGFFVLHSIDKTSAPHVQLGMVALFRRIMPNINENACVKINMSQVAVSVVSACCLPVGRTWSVKVSARRVSRDERCFWVLCTPWSMICSIRSKPCEYVRRVGVGVRRNAGG